ncbi:MAG: PQQ-binding-like beta-propeller repeat protein [Acidimicrobiia bacterium]
MTDAEDDAGDVADPQELTPSRADRRQSKRRRKRLLIAGAVAVVAIVGAGAAAFLLLRDDSGDAVATGTDQASNQPTTSSPANTDEAPTSTEAPPPPFEGWVDPASVGQPFPGASVDGLLTFRGNPTRTYYGKGPVPSAPQVLWNYPDGGMCALSVDKGEEMQWCGTGWTGQPAVFERDDRTWVTFGAYDRNVHFVDGETGADILPPFPTGDIIKGSVSIDPEGYPLLYTGSRDSFFRILAFDGTEARELWKLPANYVGETKWNDDWDSSPLILGDYLFEGGENSRFYIVKLNRGYDDNGAVTVAPELVFHEAGWDDELLAAVGSEVSIENSLTVIGDTLYFANSGGLVQGWDIGGLRTGSGPPTRVFRFWTGDDTDATVVADEQGMLYVASEWERHNERAKETGQMMKLDPAKPDDPLVWSHTDQGAEKAGVWGTPGVHEDLVIYTTFNGRALGLDRATGDVRWELTIPPPLMGSPVIVDGVWLQGDCNGTLHAYDVSDTHASPPELWSVPVGGCIESTPAVWNGRIYVGTRAGQFHALGDG